MTPAEIVAEYPDLEEEDVREALAYAAAERKIRSFRSRQGSNAVPRRRGDFT
jgi:hypothetical protein